MSCEKTALGSLVDEIGDASGRLGDMDEWIGIVVALGVGVPLLLAAVLVDWRRRRKADGELAAPPARGDLAVDSLVPTYVSQDFVDAQARPGAGQSPSPEFSGGVQLGFGHVDADFATAGHMAQWSDAAVLMVDDTISTIRELLVPLGMAASGQPLVIAAASYHPEVLASLKANRRVAQLPVVAVVANLAELMQLQDQVGGQVISASDLKAGWLPTGVMGSATRWSSDLTSTRVRGSEDL